MKESVFSSLMSLLCAFIIGAFIILILGENPIKVYWIFLYNSFFSIDGIAYTLFYATPLIYTGLAVAIGFHCGLFNIGAEGQLYIGSMAIAIVAVAVGAISAWILIPLCIIVGFVAGGFWGAIPGFLKARFGGHEVINTIMMNFIAYSLVNYLVSGPFHRKGTQILETDFIPETARLIKISHLFPFISESVPLNFSFVLALVLCFLAYLFLWKTKWGYNLRTVGSSQDVAQYAGISVKKNIVLSMFIAGGCAGLVGIHEIMGYRYTFHNNFSQGVGFFGIAVALLGKNHPVGIVLGALLFGAMNRGGLFLDIHFDSLSRDFVLVLQGIIVLLVSSDEFFKRFIRSKK